MSPREEGVGKQVFAAFDRSAQQPDERCDTQACRHAQRDVCEERGGRKSHASGATILQGVGCDIVHQARFSFTPKVYIVAVTARMISTSIQPMAEASPMSPPWK